MYLYLLEFTYAVEDREAVEMWLSQVDLGGVLISVEQYDNEILAVLASEQALAEAHKKLLQQPAVSSCVGKRCIVYRVTTTTAPKLVLRSFPLGGGEEWWLGSEKTAYLGVQSHELSEKQISWLVSSPQVAAWDDMFDLTPMPVASQRPCPPPRR